VDMLRRRTPEGKGGRRWRGRNHPEEKKKKIMGAEVISGLWRGVGMSF
jgi:hypothetical protein